MKSHEDIEFWGWWVSSCLLVPTRDPYRLGTYPSFLGLEPRTDKLAMLTNWVEVSKCTYLSR